MRRPLGAGSILRNVAAAGSAGVDLARIDP